MLFQKALQKALRFRHSFHFLSYKYNQIQWLLSGLSLASAQLELWFTARTIEMSLDSSPLPLKVCPWSDGTVPRPTRATATGSQLALHFLLTCLMANSAQIRLENNRPHWPNDFQWAVFAVARLHFTIPTRTAPQQPAVIALSWSLGHLRKRRSRFSTGVLLAS